MNGFAGCESKVFGDNINICHHDSIACPVAALQKAKPFHSFHVNLLMRPYEPPTMYMSSVN